MEGWHTQANLTIQKIEPKVRTKSVVGVGGGVGTHSAHCWSASAIFSSWEGLQKAIEYIRKLLLLLLLLMDSRLR